MREDTKEFFKYFVDGLAMFALGFLLLIGITIAARADEVSLESKSWKGYERTTIGFDSEAGTFSAGKLPSEVDAQSAKTVAEALPEVLEAKEAEMTRLYDRANAIIDAEADRPVILLTGELDMDDALDRDNLCMAVPKWEYDAATRKVTAKVFTNKLLASAPIVEAHIKSVADPQKEEVVKCAWDSYGKKAEEVTLTHQNSYTNFVIVSTPYEVEQVLVTNVTYEVTAWENEVEKTYTYSQDLVLTNSVILTIDGARPKIVEKGDRETFECYNLTFTLPEGYDEKSIDFSQWGVIGDPKTGFDLGNRQMRVNGELTLTRGVEVPLASLLSIGGTVLAKDPESGEFIEITDYDFYTDNGHTKAIKKEDSDEISRISRSRGNIDL